MQNFSTPLLVVAAALIAADGRILLQRRRTGAQHGGLWEFPGGKVEAGETPVRALIREIEEELGIALAVPALEPLAFAADAEPPRPPARSAVILLYTCRAWEGVLECREGEEIAWFAPDAIGRLAMPPLDYPLAAALSASI